MAMVFLRLGYWGHEAGEAIRCYQYDLDFKVAVVSESLITTVFVSVEIIMIHACVQQYQYVIDC